MNGWMNASKFVITCNSVLRHNPGFVTHTQAKELYLQLNTKVIATYYLLNQMKTIGVNNGYCNFCTLVNGMSLVFS